MISGHAASLSGAIPESIPESISDEAGSATTTRPAPALDVGPAAPVVGSAHDPLGTTARPALTDAGSPSANGKAPVRRIIEPGPAALHAARIAERDAENAAALLVVLGVLTGTSGAETTEPVRSLWGDPAHRLGVPPMAATHRWWASGLPG